jgi:hypothetical protein
MLTKMSMRVKNFLSLFSSGLAGSVPKVARDF